MFSNLSVHFLKFLGSALLHRWPPVASERTILHLHPKEFGFSPPRPLYWRSRKWVRTDISVVELVLIDLDCFWDVSGELHRLYLRSIFPRFPRGHLFLFQSFDLINTTSPITMLLYFDLCFNLWRSLWARMYSFVHLLHISSFVRFKNFDRFLKLKVPISLICDVYGFGKSTKS